MKFYVSFSNGERVTFPKVVESSIVDDENEKDFGFTFGEHEHKVVINKDKINFIEFIDED